MGIVRQIQSHDDTCPTFNSVDGSKKGIDQGSITRSAIPFENGLLHAPKQLKGFFDKFLQWDAVAWHWIDNSPR